jgi:hypothetical protein
MACAFLKRKKPEAAPEYDDVNCPYEVKPSELFRLNEVRCLGRSRAGGGGETFWCVFVGGEGGGLARGPSLQKQQQQHARSCLSMWACPTRPRQSAPRVLLLLADRDGFAALDRLGTRPRNTHAAAAAPRVRAHTNTHMRAPN